MENEIQTPEAIFIDLSRLLDVEVKFEPDASNAQRVSPVIDVASMLSKLIALMVYVGWNVPVHCMPPYNRVHADIEYWKKQFEVKAVPAAPSAAQEQPVISADEAAQSEKPADAGS